MGIGRAIVDFCAASGALVRWGTGQAEGRIATMRFVTRSQDGTSGGATQEGFVWLEATKSATAQAYGDDGLYNVFQRQAGKSGALEGSKKEAISVDGSKIFSLAQTIEILSSWEEEAKAATDVLRVDPHQPLQRLHFSKRKIK